MSINSGPSFKRRPCLPRVAVAFSAKVRFEIPELKQKIKINKDECFSKERKRRNVERFASSG